MAQYVLAAGQQSPGKIALSVLGETGTEDWTFAQLEASIRGIATGLQQAGCGPGERVLLRLGNRPEYPLAYLAAIAIGAIPVPTSPQLTERETAKIISDLSPKLILHEPDVPCPDHPARLSLSAVSQMMDLPPAEYVMGAPNRPAYIVYTSGTSGQPRAVLHAHRAIWARRMMHEGWYGLRADDRMLHAGAFNWTYTMGTGLMDPWSVGATALIPAPGTLPERIPDLLRNHKATIFAAAPGVYRKFLTDGMRINTAYLRRGLSAGEKLSPAIRAAWQAASGTEICEAYGMSECSTFISTPPGAQLPQNALGRPQLGRKIAIVDETGSPVSQDHEGTIAVHRCDPGMMLEYLNAPAETAARFKGDWFVTGDQGAMDAQGNITYLGRRDDMMNAGGFRVSPLEVEAALSALPGITSLAVTDIEVKPDVRVIMAFFTAPTQIDAHTLSAFASETLAAYKTPRAFIQVDALPTGPNGKLARAQLPQFWSPDD